MKSMAHYNRLYG